MPHAVPTRSLYDEYFEDVDDHSHQLAPFIKTVSKHLRAFLSRKDQCDRLRQRYDLLLNFNNYIYNINNNRYSGLLRISQSFRLQTTALLSVSPWA